MPTNDPTSNDQPIKVPITKKAPAAWMFGDPAKLSDKAVRELEKADELIVAAMEWWQRIIRHRDATDEQRYEAADAVAMLSGHLEQTRQLVRAINAQRTVAR